MTSIATCVAIAILTISSCSFPFEDEITAPTPSPTLNVFTTPTPRPNDDEIESLVGQDFSLPNTGFFIRYPADWTPDTRDPGGFDVVFRAPKADRDHTGRSFAAISVANEAPEHYEPVRGRQFLENTLKEGVTFLTESLESLRLIRAYVQRLPAGEVAIFEYSYNTPTAGRLHSLQYVVPGQTKIFLVTLTSLDSVWQQYSRTFEVSMATFTILAGK